MSGKSLLDYLYVILGTAFGRGIAFLNSILIARLLGPEKFGVFAFFFAVLMLTWMIPGAFDTAYLRHSHSANSNEEKDKFLTSSLISKSGLGLILFCFIAVVDRSVAAAFFGKDYVYPLLLAGIGAGLFLNYVMTQATIYREKGHFHLFAIVTNIHTIIVFMSLASLYFSEKQLTLKNVISIYCIAAAVTGTLAILMIWRIGGLRLPGMKLFGKFLSWAKWMFLLTLVFATFERMDFFVLTKYLEPADIGIYAAGAQLTLIISVTTGALNNVFVPKAVAALTSRATLKAYIRESIVPVVVILTIITILILTAPLLVAGLYGARYQTAATIVRIISLGWLGSAIYLPFSFLFYALDEPQTRFFLELTKLLLGLSLLLVLIPPYGAVGAAASMALAHLINSVVSGLVLRNRLQRTDLQRKKRMLDKSHLAAEEEL